jgi:dipeptidyl aminopeptidase/acylaminoacyl peptidase
MRPLALALALAVALTGCRDGRAPFAPRDRLASDTAGGLRLTYDPRNDQSPAWSTNGDSIYYTSWDLDEEIAGQASLYVIAVQDNGARETVRLPRDPVNGVGAAVTRDRIAFSIPSIFPVARICTGVQFCAVPRPVYPRLLSVRYEFRTRPGVPQLADSVLILPLSGINGPGNGPIAQYQTFLHPFQRFFVEDRGYPLRPSWSPEGRRLIVTNGLRLSIWAPGQPLASIPATDDGVYPAWSPDGVWLAFTKLERGPVSTGSCSYADVPEGPITCATGWTAWTTARKWLALVRPGALDVRYLSDGVAPAWSPDGTRLYFQRSDAIWSINLDGTNAAPVPNTEGGIEPAVSPDGTRLAFARASPSGDFDLWVVRLAQ